MSDRWSCFSRGRTLRAASLIVLTLAVASSVHSPRAAAQLRALEQQVALAGGAPRLEIELPDEAFEQLSTELARRSALGGVRGDDRGKRVKASGFARGAGPRVKVRISLLEEWSERLEGGRWPLFVDVRGGATLYGIDRFSLRAPAIRGYHAEILMLEHLRREGVLAPRVFFVRASLNGEELGLMKLDEELGKDMVEAHERRDGAILRFEDSGAEAAEAPGLARAPDDFLARPLVFERPSRAKKAPSQARDRKLAVELLAGFLAGSVDAREVFDVDLMARFLAVCELWRAVDSVRWSNLRFYFNPVTKRLEPIAYAASPPALVLDEGLVATSKAWPVALLVDPELRVAFQRHLKRVAAEALDGSTEAWLREEEAPLLRMLRSEHRVNDALAFDPIVAHARRLANFEIGPAPDSGPGGAVLETVGRPPVYNPVPKSTRAQALERHPFLVWDDAFGGFEVRPGIHEVQGALVLPDGAGLRIGPGTTLRFGAREILLATGPLVFIGTAEQPVVLEGRIKGDGSRAGWQGLVVLHSERSHTLAHVEVRGTTGIDRAGWQLTGGFTVRASTLDMRSTRIVGSRAEDALNLIRAQFQLRDVEIVDALSDAVDLDFSTGSITGGRFAGLGGDAIDANGAVVTIEGVVIENVRDKALSVGEHSRAVARNITIDRVGTAVASKDGSVTLIEDSKLRRVTHAALMAYVKKPNYGPAELEARRVEMEMIGRPALAQLGSRVVIDGAVQAAEAVDVDGLYKSGYMVK